MIRRAALEFDGFKLPSIHESHAGFVQELLQVHECWMPCEEACGEGFT